MKEYDIDLRNEKDCTRIHFRFKDDRHMVLKLEQLKLMLESAITPVKPAIPPLKMQCPRCENISNVEQFELLDLLEYSCPVCGYVFKSNEICL